MFAAFAKTFYKKAIQEGFEAFVHPNNSNLITDDTRQISFQKRVGQDLCVARVFNANMLDAALYTAEHADAVAHMAQAADNSYVSRVFVIDMFVGDTIGSNFLEMIYNGEEFMDQRVYTIRWGVPLEQPEAQLYADTKQPTTIGNVHAIVLESLLEYHKLGDTGSGSVSDIEREVAQSSPFKVRVSIPFITYMILALNAVMLAVIYMSGGPNNETLLMLGALESGRVFVNGEYYRLFTVMLLHSGLLHLAANSLALYIFGTRVERYCGHALFLTLYVLSGLGASLCCLMFIRGVSVGASGAISGLMGATVALALVSRRAIDGLSLSLLFMYIVFSIGYGFVDPTVANAAHIGGMITGFLIAYVICTIVSLSERRRDE